MFDIFFADDWIWTADLLKRKRPLYQLSHNHCPNPQIFDQLALLIKELPVVKS